MSTRAPLDRSESTSTCTSAGQQTVMANMVVPVDIGLGPFESQVQYELLWCW